MKNGLKRIADAIARTPDIAAVLVPRRLALELVDEMYPDAARPSLDGVSAEAFDLVVGRARETYLRLVGVGGYIGTVMSVPMVVADDVVVCPLTEQELTDSAPGLGVDLGELRRDRRRGS